MIYLPNLIWCNVYIHQGLSDNTVGIFYAVGAGGTKTDIQKFFTITDENVYVGISKSEYDTTIPLMNKGVHTYIREFEGRRN